MSTQRIIGNDTNELMQTAAARFVKLAATCISEHGNFAVALAGGGSAKVFYQTLAQAEYSSQIDWSEVLIYFSDERAVGPEDELSNYKMASDALLRHVPIPSENIFRLKGESESLEAAAADYGVLIVQLGRPLDLVSLGMGDDGHTASLFPHSPVLQQSTQRVAATPVASLKPHIRRLTFTFPTINEARVVWVFVTGENKATRVQQILEGESTVEETPARGVSPDNGELCWMLDKAAASQLATARGYC